MGREFVYLAVIIDLHSRGIRGWWLDRDLSSTLTHRALDRALAKHGPPKIHHSDHGVQYMAKGYVEVVSPVKGITYPKEREKPPFRTFEQIESIVDRGGLTKREVRELWDGVFLDKGQVAEVLAHVKGHTSSDWLYPFFVVAAHTLAMSSRA